MDSAKLNGWMQVAGIFAVVLSLIFVGMQMKQSHEIALADQYQSRSDAAQNMYLTMYEGGFTFGTDLRNAENWTPHERNGVMAISLWSWAQYDNHYYQYTAGFLDDEAWLGQSNRIQILYDNCEMRSVWDFVRPLYRQSFVAFVESLDDVCKPPN